MATKKRVLFIILLVFIVSVVFSVIPPQERAALIALYNATNGDNWNSNSNWKGNNNEPDGFSQIGTEGTWHGVSVSGDHVTNISLSSNQLSGSIPSELGNLGNLLGLMLYSNQLTGSIPSALGNLSNLAVLSLYSNQLNGSIPPELGNLSNLKHLYLQSNNLSGSIPSALGNLSNLQYFKLYNNQLSGSIPSALGNLSNLQYFYLYNNQLSGSIPSEFGKLNNLLELWMDNNQLSGNLPPELGNLSNLMGFHLSDNRLSGSIPPELGNLSNLLVLSLAYNQLGGSIPPELGNLSNLERLYLTSNQLSGSIPSELGNLSNLRYLYLCSNQLSGSIPISLTNLTELYSSQTNIGYNCLYTDNNTLRIFLNSKDPDWENTQTIAPKNISAAAISTSVIRVSWDVISYTNDAGGYRVYYRTTPQGLWTCAGMTADKYATFYDIKGLNPGTKYYFVVKTQTDSHSMNKNTVVSEYSKEASTTTMGPVTYTLTIQSSPDTGAIITISPNDNSGNGNGITNFTRTYNEGTEVTLTAPWTHNGGEFSKWTIDGADNTNLSIQVTMSSDHTLTAIYETAISPSILLNRSRLNYGASTSGPVTPAQFVFIENSGGGTLNWSVTVDSGWINCYPTSGVNTGNVSVRVDPSALSVGSHTGAIFVTDPDASNSPQKIDITLTVYKPGMTSKPFGEFATPLNGSTVRSSIPVTGWILDDIGVESVKIYRKEGDSLGYIGDAVFVDGARPDVEQAFPGYPFNYRAGWGYMMLTNFLPNGGNGTFDIHAIAVDIEGNQVPLGIKTITCDNANAVKPFGAIDTPAQGGTVSGTSFINWGWVLTPQPNQIPMDGSTIGVWIDGVKVGQPTYNIYREDIAELFPSYANSNNAAGYFYLDTTAYKNGVHTIQWTVADSAGNTDGIGSRYFTIQNSGYASNPQSLVTAHRSLGNETIYSIPINYHKPVILKKGCQPDTKIEEIYPDKNGIIDVKTRELERVEIHLRKKEELAYGIPGSATAKRQEAWRPGWTGYQVIGDHTKALPIGAFLDTERGVFYWQPGPGFLGEYRFVFWAKEANIERSLRKIVITIEPIFSID